ncbi:MAG: hypothetical protein R3A52_03095 [Polyangiales bacterium]
MSLTEMVRRYGVVVLAGALCASAAGCATDADLTAGDGEVDPDEIIGANAVGRWATVQSFVYVRTGASDAEVQRAVVRQLRPLFGALKANDIGLGNRLDTSDATRFVDASTFERSTVDVIDPAHPGERVGTMDRVRFTYRDRATVNKRLQYRRAFETTALFGDYERNGDAVVQRCQSEHQDWGTSGLWYNFEPHLSSCQSLIRDEVTRVEADRRALTNADQQVTQSETARMFLPITVRLSSIARTETRYPDYHRLVDDGRLVIASYFGVDNLDDPRDYGARNYFTFLRTVMAARPELRISSVSPSADLTTVEWRGATITDVTPDRVAGWVVDGSNFPSSVSYSDRDAFRRQVLAQWRDKTVTLSASGTLTTNGAARPIELELRAFYGNEEGFGTGATERYRRAFHEVDVFQYTGHSHLGSGPLDARNYSPADFPDRYQVLMVNSCVSFNYYNTFFTMHPGGTLNLDTVTNGLPVYLEGSGLSSARFVNAFIDGRFRSYNDILASMRVDLPWERGHDANRVADGETDNTFTPSRYRMSLALTR